MLRTGRLFHLASHPASRPRTEASLPGTLASPRAGLPPAGCRELVARLRRLPPFSLAPELLDARRVQQSESRRPAIFVDQTAEHVSSFDRRSGSPPDLRCSVPGGYGQAQSSMWSLLYVVSDVSLEHSLEVPTTVDQDVVEALSAHGPHEPLREGVGSRCADRCSDHPGALSLEHLVERS